MKFAVVHAKSTIFVVAKTTGSWKCSHREESFAIFYSEHSSVEQLVTNSHATIPNCHAIPQAVDRGLTKLNYIELQSRNVNLHVSGR